MLTVYHTLHARSMRVIWMLNELGLDHEIISVEFQELFEKSDRLMSRHPLGALPILEDGEVRLFESATILEYLCHTHGEGRFLPAYGTPAYWTFSKWMHFAEGSATAAFVSFAHHTLIRPEADRNAFVAEESKQRAARVLAAYEQSLQETGFLAGDTFTAADVMNGYTINMGKAFGMLTDELPKTKAYYYQLRQRPAFRKTWGLDEKKSEATVS